MRVLLVGATGAIGRPLLPRLLAAGHEVTALTRTTGGAERLRAAGAAAVITDALDPAALRAAVLAAAPEVVVNQLTALPARIDPRRYEEAMAATARLRREAGPVLAAAGAEAGARRIVAQSVCFLLAPEGPWVRDESAPLISDPPRALREAVASLGVLEEATLGTTGIEGVVLRYGFFYGPGTSIAPDGSMVDDVRRRRMPVVGSGSGTFSFIHVDDAAAATVLALDGGAPGISNVVDDEPIAQREWVRLLAQAADAPRPLRVPGWLGRLLGGPLGAAAVSLRGSSNAKARAELGWSPATKTVREGFPAMFAGGAAQAPGRVPG